MWLVRTAHPAHAEKIHHGDDSVTVMWLDGMMNGDKQEMIGISSAPCRCNWQSTHRCHVNYTRLHISISRNDATSQHRRTSLDVNSTISEEATSLSPAYTCRRSSLIERLPARIYSSCTQSGAHICCQSISSSTDCSLQALCLLPSTI